MSLTCPSIYLLNENSVERENPTRWNFKHKFIVKLYRTLYQYIAHLNHRLNVYIVCSVCTRCWTKCYRYWIFIVPRAAVLKYRHIYINAVPPAASFIPDFISVQRFRKKYLIYWVRNWMAGVHLQWFTSMRFLDRLSVYGLQ